MTMSECAPGYPKSAGYSRLILGITAVTCSRVVLALFHDPEGPNLVVVGGMAAVIYAIALAAYLAKVFPSLAGTKRTATAIGIQIVVAAGIYFWLR